MNKKKRANSRPRVLSGLCAAALILAIPGRAQLKINEVYYNVSPQGGYQYVELRNMGPTNAFLDGMVLTDEAGAGTEGVFQFPGLPGETNHPVAAGARLIIAVDATNDTVAADWECYAGGVDMDNPAVSNLVRVGGSDDLGFFTGGDNCLLATGGDTSAPIDDATIVDGVNFGGGSGELAPLSATATDHGSLVTSSNGLSLGRCPDGADRDYASSDDFFQADLTPGGSNLCQLSFLSVGDASVREGNFGTTSAVFTVNMSPANSSTVMVRVVTADGSAVVGSDFVELTGTLLVFAPGVTSVTSTARAQGDFYAESNEVFSVRLVSVTNAGLLDASGEVAILDDDTGVVVFSNIAGSDTAITSTWTTVAGHLYQVESPTDFRANAWTNVGGVVTATDVFMSIVDTSTTGALPQVYRVLHLQ